MKFWQKYYRDLGIGLSSLIHALTPKVIAIGGGVSASGNFFLPTAIAELEGRVMPTSRIGLEILTSKFGNSADNAWCCKINTYFDWVW